VILNNDDITKVLTMEMTIAALEEAYLGIASKKRLAGAHRTLPTKDQGQRTPNGAAWRRSTSGLFRHPNEIRRGSRRVQRRGARRRNTAAAGVFCGLILLTSIEKAAAG